MPQAAKVTTLPDFNPSKDQRVDEIKGATDRLINFVRDLEGIDPRCQEIAIQHYETAAMFAVKALFVGKANG